MSVLQTAIGLCLQGDIPAAYQLLQSHHPKTRREQAFEQGLYQRFLAAPPTYRIRAKDPWVRNVIRFYDDYFIYVLTNQGNAADADSFLLSRLHQIVSGRDLDEAEAELESTFQRKGYRFLGGVTQPYRGPYIWQTEETTHYEVEIPGRTQTVSVTFMTDFVMLGWQHFATLGRRFVGGWATESGLFCVYDAYKHRFHHPDFEVCYLKHEAQHFADYKQFPGIQPKDLEYRAKLVELIYYPTKRKLLDFVTQARSDASHAHAYAAYTIVRHLTKELFPSDDTRLSETDWKAVKTGEVQALAGHLLQKHGEALYKGAGI